MYRVKHIHTYPVSWSCGDFVEGDIESSEESLGGDDEAFFKEWDDLNRDEKLSETLNYN